MKKLIIVGVMLSGVSAVSYAQSSVTLYGLIDTGISYISNASTPAGHSSLFRYGDGVASGSRWGLRGAEDLGGGLKAIFVLENGFNSGDGTLQQGGALFGRQAYVGIGKDGIGTLTFGRQYSLTVETIGSNYTMGGQTAAGNYAYHINDLDQLVTSRVNNSVKFSSANFDGLTFGGMYGFSNQAGAFAGSPTTTTAGTTTQGSSSAYSFGVNFARDAFSLGAAYMNIRFPNGATPAFSTSIANVNTGALKGIETYGLGGKYSFSSAAIFGNWTHTKLSPISTETSILDNLETGGRYSFTPALSAGIGYTFSRLKGATSGRWHQVNGVLDYALSKRTDVYVLASYQKALGSNVVGGQVVPVQAEIGDSTSFVGTSGRGASDQFVGRLGLRHRF
ncbi:porin [Paraburkholderia sediminicola]|uniref:Porin n=1 Tax=Paraburkholderia metrosideri TaxID=580937 RepID=A0ABW9DZR7_9BURK